MCVGGGGTNIPHACVCVFVVGFFTVLGCFDFVFAEKLDKLRAIYQGKLARMQERLDALAAENQDLKLCNSWWCLSYYICFSSHSVLILSYRSR